jgi:hypothetical protein
MRVCADCGTSLDGYRRQAIYCGGPCRATASRARVAERREPTKVGPAAGGDHESAHTRTGLAREAADWPLATPAEEALAERLRRQYPEWWEAA